ncbi:MAG: asparagine synthase (glutamine-hydrolyzing) [Caldilinea sp. CFX5]|nr:asparagine synthase (glutamine-hydrolyzing) [Caldilinea sp. CFX5]
MCGIVGVYAFRQDANPIELNLLNIMRDKITHRGPDGARSWLSADGRVGLGFRRLAIVDLADRAMQPMSNEDETIHLVFNGEIYNHAEIRAELEQIGGHVWKTHHSDTETIVHAYEEWGIDCLARLRGMFAIAIWDSKTQYLWLIRDRIGIKPLYYTISNDRIAFASEIKALLADPNQKRVVHAEAFYHYLSFLTTPAPQTLFAGIKKLPNGCWLRISTDGQIVEQRYWDVWDHTTPFTNCTENEITQRLLTELDKAVQIHKVSDVPVGIFLSGGIDSSTNAALFSRDECKPIKTFSIGYQGNYQSYQNEVHYARKMAELVKADHHELLLTQDDLLNFLPQMICLQDEPIADPVCIPVYYVSKLAREHGVIVCQVGEGADELFCGYPFWQRALQFQTWLDNPFVHALHPLGVLGLRFARKEYSLYAEWLQRNKRNQPIFWGGAEAFTEYDKQRLLSSHLRKQLKGLTSWQVIQPIHRRFEAQAWEKSALNWMSYVDLNLRLPELLLMRVDKMSMGVSLEGRVPFLDHKFVEFAMSIPTSVKVRNGTLKYILKKAVRGVIPDELIDRKKQGFHIPIHEWFFDRLGASIRRTLDEFCEQTEFIDHKAVSELITRKRSLQVWYLFNFALWWQEYIR